MYWQPQIPKLLEESYDDPFWEMAAGKRVVAAKELKGPGYFWRRVNEMKHHSSVWPKRPGEALSGEDLVRLEVAAEGAKAWPAGRVPQELWQRIKLGRVKNRCIQILAPLLVKLTEKPGLALTIDVSFLNGPEESERDNQLRAFYESREWVAYNFRDWHDLESFEQRLNRVFRWWMLAGTNDRLPEYPVYQTMYDEDDHMEIFRYLPDKTGGWELHPTVAGSLDGRWADPPHATSHHSLIDVWRQLLGETVDQEKLEEIGYRYSLLVAKEMVLWRIVYMGYALLVEGI